MTLVLLLAVALAVAARYATGGWQGVLAAAAGGLLVTAVLRAALRPHRDEAPRPVRGPRRWRR